MTSPLTSRIENTVAKANSGVISAASVLAAAEAPLPTGLTSHELYCIVAFVRHERRQMWVGWIVESRLKVQGTELARFGAFAHPEEASSGDVPGEDGWSYYFHGRGCCLTHADGTLIDVDFADDGSALDIDPSFYNHYLESIPNAEWCERQLKQPEGFENAWQFELPELTAKGLIQGQWRFRLTENGRRLGELLEPIIELLNAASTAVRCYLLCELGDFENATLEARAGEITAPPPHFLEANDTKRIAHLRNVLRGPDTRHINSAIAALGLMGPERSFAELEAIISRKPVSGANHSAMDVLKSWKHPYVTKCLASVFTAMAAKPRRYFLSWFSRAESSSTHDHSHNYLMAKLAEELMSRFGPSDMPKPLKELVEAMCLKRNPDMEDESAFLLFLIEPNRGLGKFALNLGHRAPGIRSDTAVFLTLIGGDDCIELLIQTAGKSPEQGGHEAACALSLLKNQRAQAAAAEWQRRNDGYEDAEGQEIEMFGQKRKTWSFDEITRANMSKMIAWKHKEFQKRFGPLLARWRPI